MAATQEVVTISSEPPLCEVVVEETLSLGALDDPGTIGWLGRGVPGGRVGSPSFTDPYPATSTTRYRFLPARTTTNRPSMASSARTRAPISATLAPLR